MFPLIVSEQKNPNPSAFRADKRPARVAVYERLYVIEFTTIVPVPQDKSAVVTSQEYFVVALTE